MNNGTIIAIIFILIVLFALLLLRLMPN